MDKRGGRERYLGLVAGGVLALTGGLHVSAAAQSLSLHIPAGNASKSIPELARQANVQIIGPGEPLHSIFTPEINGSYDVTDVLEMMLKGTGLKVSRTAEGVIMISPRATRNVCNDEGETMNNSTKLKTAASWLAILAASIQCAAAQDADTVETVVVTGIRNSLQQNLDIKRESPGLVDAITMEDIGKFPDSNLATAMMRIPGITVTRTSTAGVATTGQATQITARGFGPSFNETVFDGRFIPSASGGRSFDFSVLSSDLVQELDVLKTPDATLSAGAIGATVNVKYPKPFDKPELTVAAASSTSYSPEDGRFTPNGNVLVSKTFDGTHIGKIGILLAGAYNDIKTTTKQASIWGWEGDYIDNCQLAGATTACGSTLTKNTSRPIWFIQDYSATYRRADEERINARAAVQWQPINSLLVTVDGNFSRYNFKAQDWAYAIWNNVAQMRNIKLSSNGTVTDFTRVNSTTDFDSDYNMQVTQTHDFGINAKWSVNSNLDVLVDFDQALSSQNPGHHMGLLGADIGYGPTSTNGTNGSDIEIIVPGGHNLPYYASYGPNNNKSQFADYSLLGSHTALMTATRNRYLTNQGKVEATWTDEDWKVTAGLSYVANHYHTAYYTDNSKYNDVIAYLGYGPASNNPTGVSLPSSLFQGTISLKNFISGWKGSPVPSLVKFDPYDYYAYLASLGDPWAKNIPGFYYGAGATDFHGTYNVIEDIGSPNQVNEDNFAPYISGSANLTVDGMPLAVNAGLRFETTRMKSFGKYAVLRNMVISAGDPTAYVFTFDDSPSVIAATHNYSYFLPNLDAKLQVRDDMTIRFDASVTMTRPGLGAVVPSLSLGGRVGTLVGTNNNPNLKPYLSRNFDIAEEWYFAPNSYFSIDTFFKQVSNFNISGTTKLTTTGVVDPYTGKDAVFTITTQLNGPMANVYGTEIALQYVFGDTGFGVQTNGTLIDTDKKFDPNDLTTSGFAVTGLADSFNATAFYDKNGFEARFAANWRDTYLDHFGQSQNASTFGIEPTFVEASWSLDASVSYDVTSQINVYAEAQNLLGAVYHTRGRFTDQPLDIVDYGRHITFGMHYKM